MTYTRNSSWTTKGQASADAIQAWFEHRGPSGAQYVGLPYKPPPSDLGVIIVEECKVYGINHDLKAAQIAHETGSWQSHIVRDKNNPSGIGAVNDNAYEGALTYETPREGIRASVAHLMGYIAGDGPWNVLSPRYALVKQNGWQGTVQTLGNLEQKWAWSPQAKYDATPVGQRYGSRLAAIANELLAFAGDAPPTKEIPMPVKPLIAIAAGHHNTNRGGAVGEYERVGPLAREIAKQLKVHGGFEVHMITPNDGMGDFNGGLQDVAREAVRLKAHCFLEIHMEGNGGGDGGRGCFTIYPDWTGDLDADVRDRLGPDMAARVRSLTALPLRGNGLMSERATGVGASGYRLGAFGASEPAKEYCTRLLFEYGALTSPRDRAIIDGPDFNRRAAEATVGALVAFYGVQQHDEPIDPRMVPKPHPDARGFTATGQWIVWGFKDYWQQFDNDTTSIEVFGYPLTGELPFVTSSGAQGAIQYFERSIFEYHPDLGRVLLRRLGAHALEAA